MGKRFITSRDLPHLKDENGKPLCRWCKKPVTPPRRSWCSDECVREYLIRSSGDSLRRAVFKRDKGMCAGCGADTEKIRRLVSFAIESFEGRDADPYGYGWGGGDIWRIFTAIGFNWNRLQTLWEADHIIEVSNDGETSLDNMQTLCVPCHKAKTRKMHADRKFDRTGIRPKQPSREVQLSMI